MRLGVDLMGGETPPEELALGVIEALEHIDGDVEFTLFTTDVASLRDTIGEKVQYCSVSTVIEMTDDPLESVRRKRDSSLVRGVLALKEGRLDGFVSIGNTGALVAAATLFLEKHVQIRRLALLALLPTQTGVVAVIDVGGNVSCQAEDLLQFAQMGVEYIKLTQGVVLPRVGLLNIGGESQKGTSEVRRAYRELQKEDLAFVGNIEPAHVFEGKVDVLVTNGFTGNVFLKASEGMAVFMCDHLRNQSVDQEVVDELYRRFNYAEYPGAILCGLEQLVIKCHGHSSSHALATGLVGAYRLYSNH